MDSITPPVKQRSYDSSRRQQQARQTRDEILSVARRRFLRDGYAASTIASLADDVGVSIDTIYKTFGGKPGLVRAIHEQSLAGEGPIAAESRSDALQASETDPWKIMLGLGRLIAEVAPRVCPIMLLIRDAALADPEMAGLKRELDDLRLERMTHNARNLADAGHLRKGLTAERAGEIMWAYSAPEFYELLVVGRAWKADRYGTFVADAMAAHLLSPQKAGIRRSV
ncbi:MAG: putative transcriptional regulator, TetR family protein [Ilumatobacteraceae bacterium]|nr:putative transcriptional regulator, TetR family protein [Ilumatobacteraceae bacterium]